jgi:hypothetical protein
MFGQSPCEWVPPLAAYIGCPPNAAGGELEAFDPELPAAIATVAQTAAATATARTANQRLGRLELVSLMRTSFLFSRVGGSM